MVRLAICAVLLPMIALTRSQPFVPEQTFEAAALPVISNTINAFAYYVDHGQFDQLSRVFTPDASFNTSFSIVHGLDAIIASVSSLKGVSSQHGYTTQYTQFTSECAANASAYLTNNFYGQGAKKGQIFTVYGRYDFEMILVKEGWRAKSLTLTQLASTGDITIVFPNGAPS